MFEWVQTSQWGLNIYICKAGDRTCGSIMAGSEFTAYAAGKPAIVFLHLDEAKEWVEFEVSKALILELL